MLFYRRVSAILFVKYLMQPDPHVRPSSAQALDHPVSRIMPDQCSSAMDHQLTNLHLSSLLLSGYLPVRLNLQLRGESQPV